MQRRLREGIRGLYYAGVPAVTQPEMEARIRRLEKAIQCLAILIMPDTLKEAAATDEEREKFYEATAEILTALQADLDN